MTPAARTNIVVILADDLGYSDVGCFGGEINTPRLDALAAEGVRVTSFYNTARCSPSRASLLTGRHPHQTGIGVLTDDHSPYGGYPGTLRADVPTVAERLKEDGYATCLSGKWHLSSNTAEPDHSWPTRRGFDEFYGIMPGADSYFHPGNLWHGERRCPVPEGDFYLTDAVSEHAAGFVRSAARDEQPFFLYLAYTAPHWPLHAPESDIQAYEGVYDRGWDELRADRHRRMRELGIVGTESALSDRDPTQPPWRDVADPEWEARRMSTYAAQVQRMDAGIGRVIDALDEAGVRENTLVVFLSDNGACAEELPPPNAPHFHRRQPSRTPDGRAMSIGNRPQIRPGPADTYTSYGRAWANLSNTPFRFYKRWVHEGGIATPFIASWPAGGLAERQVVNDAFQLTDILATICAVSGTPAADAAGVSMLPTLRGAPDQSDHPLFWEHVGNAAARAGRWKIVREAGRPWELYDMSVDRSELIDLADRRPEVVADLAARWDDWARSVGVIPWEKLRGIVSAHGG
ncbi:arylsulfatase [Plantactinospora sp. KBS50]|uniref:arylsulfatase n=1 Tax=Plantactinospora sp. KBS50 TaxID=2024580 RepID=UPI000BAABD75|nr:arylsulfatase [Plantactinospora sp. KBS50]ASW55742.1 arylsulfatase [Plantactinospora sp. KBS50]